MAAEDRGSFMLVEERVLPRCENVILRKANKSVPTTEQQQTKLEQASFTPLGPLYALRIDAGELICVMKVDTHGLLCR